MTKIFLGIAILATASVGVAASSSNSSYNSVANPTSGLAQNTQRLETQVSPGPLAGPELMLGLKSYNDMGRPEELRDDAGKRFKSKNEYFLGVKTKAGWGIYGQAVETAKEYGDYQLNRFSPGDPSVTLLHPLYESKYIKVSGALREYFPVTDKAQAYGIYQQAYYSKLLAKLPHSWDLYNEVTPRNFYAQYYDPSDTVFFVEWWSIFSKQYARWFRAGLGQHTMWEWHSETPTGNTVEIFPTCDFMLNQKIYIGPRVFFPVAVQNSVFDAPKAVSLSQMQAEIFFQATL